MARTDEESYEVGQKLADAVQTLFWDSNGLSRIMRQRGDKVEGLKLSPAQLDIRIQSPIKLEGNIERGSHKNGRRTHAHFTVTFRHFKHLQFDRLDVANEVVRELNDPRISNVFVRIKGRQLAEGDAVYTEKTGKGLPPDRLPKPPDTPSESINRLIAHDDEDPSQPTTRESISIGGSL